MKVKAARSPKRRYILSQYTQSHPRRQYYWPLQQWETQTSQMEHFVIKSEDEGRLKVHWNVTSWRWVCSSRRFKGRECLHRRGVLDCLTLKVMAPRSFKTLGTIIQRYVVTTQNTRIQQHRSETLKFLTIHLSRMPKHCSLEVYHTVE